MVRQAARESVADTMEAGQGGVESCSVNHWLSNTRDMVCRTKHFVWSAHGAGMEAKLSFVEFRERELSFE